MPVRTTAGRRYLLYTAGPYLVCVAHEREGGLETFYREELSVAPAAPHPESCHAAGYGLDGTTVVGSTTQLMLVVSDAYGNLCPVEPKQVTDRPPATGVMVAFGDGARDVARARFPQVRLGNPGLSRINPGPFPIRSFVHRAESWIGQSPNQSGMNRGRIQDEFRI